MAVSRPFVPVNALLRGDAKRKRPSLFSGQQWFLCPEGRRKTGYLVCPLEHPKESDRQVVKTVNAGVDFFKERDRPARCGSLSKESCMPCFVLPGCPQHPREPLLSATIPDDGAGVSHTRMCNVAFGRFLFLQGEELQEAATP